MITLISPPERNTERIEAFDNLCGGYSKSIGCIMVPINSGYEVKWKVNTANANMLCRITIADSIIFKYKNRRKR